ncbi:alkaline phosphatase PhoX [Pseudobacteriovorax antillogorgiicola]|uniref:Secreted phosphatase, PhoX family n=1 Tax=Pseudobacteriovorax antillogorgiicola TaxID=1513793 RepID=A0A1Y6CQ93_9BACT|nr:alkaline phosphatase PhoX [Pseudobacteriovorax antillogorgiicola]TCS46196.1 secreted PhoX family phosphatase [Pseudobacteriovorax antillogorgiicola]SMF70164.1 Secreted phosphatase, PhoX family [Pseudobacteriovorax antillogorgiicola]
MTSDFNRRSFLKSSMGSFGFLSLGTQLTSMASGQELLDFRSLKSLGPLGSPDSQGIRLPQGFSSRQIARTGHRVVRDTDGRKTDYRWHIYPDGGACFPQNDGGWVYTSNSEIFLAGGAGAIRFNADGQIEDAYGILGGTSQNCAGGATPWGTWLSCEEIPFGSVFECDVVRDGCSEKRSGLGKFKHEAVAIDPVNMQAYLTEDEGDGCFYRYTPASVDLNGRMDLDNGLLEVAVEDGGFVSWVPLENSTPGLFQTPTRKQIRNATKFDGGEGISFHEGMIYFTTKGDNRVWFYDTNDQSLGLLYDKATSDTPILSGVDNVTVSKDGHVLVAEDGGQMQIVVIGPWGDVYPLVKVENQDHSEITGPAISPNGKRLYFSSQRGINNKFAQNTGVTYEIQGIFES